MKHSWYGNCLRQLCVDFEIPEHVTGALARFDAKSFVDQVERGRVNMVVALFAKGHPGACFYNTKKGHIHAKLEKDFLFETATECRKRGIRTLAYYSVCLDTNAYEENPAWRYIDEEGNPMRGLFGQVCLNTPYKDELAMPQLEEIATDYPVDGFFVDIPVPLGLNDGLCYCDCCRRRWKEEFDIELSPMLHAEVKQKLVMRTMEGFFGELRALIERINPELVICSNTVGSSRVSKSLKELVDIGCWESQPQPGDFLGHSYCSRILRNDIVEGQVMTVRFYRGWGDQTLKPRPQLTTECAAMIGNGMPACCGDQGETDGTLQAPVYDVLDEAFGFVQEREEILKDAQSVRHTVVLLAVPDPQLPFVFGCHNIEDLVTYKEDPAVWRGAHKMLVESHIQADLVYSVLADDLRQYPMLILPEPGTYQPGMHENLREYVKAGGILVAVGNSLLDKGKFHLEDVFGIHYVEPLSYKLGHFVPNELVKGVTENIPLQHRGEILKVALDGAKELAALHYPIGENQPPVKTVSFTFPAAAEKRSPYPFCTVNNYGKGKALYVAGSIFSTYWRTNHHWLRQFMEALLRYVDPAMPYEVEASGLTEANLMRAKSDLLLNLIHYTPGHQGSKEAIPSIEYAVAAYDIKCAVRSAKPDKVLLEPSGETIEFQWRDGVCRFTVPRIKYMAIVRLTGGCKN